MAQIKKHQKGGTANLVQKPAEVVKPVKNQLKFLVDGEEFLMDETEFNSIASKAFATEVGKGQAKLRDKNKWMQEFQTKLTEAKNGVFNVQSSGDTVSNLTYTPNNASYDGSASDGMAENGQAAQRTGVGRFLAPRVSGNSDQMGAILNNYIGEGVVNSRKNYLSAQEAKANEEQTKLTNKYNASIDDDAKTFLNPSLGRIAYDKDWDDPISKKLILDKVYSDEPGHVDAIDKAYQGFVKKVFDPYYDDKLDEYKKRGVDLAGMRSRFSNIYDSTTGVFKTPLKGMSDFYRYADSMDSMVTDSPLFNKDAYLNLGKSGVPKTPEQIAAETAEAAKAKAENDAKIAQETAAANAEKAKINGKQADGIIYAGGVPITGKYVPSITGADGSTIRDWYNPDTGFLVEGKKVEQSAFEAYLEKIKTDPNKASTYSQILQRNNNVDRFHANDNQVNSMTSSFLEDDYKNMREQGNYAFKQYEGTGFAPTGAGNLTSMFRGDNDQPIKGGIFNIQSKTLNNLGLPTVDYMVATDDGKNFRGILKRDASGKLRLFKREGNGNLTPISDPSLDAMLNSIKSVKAGPLSRSRFDLTLNRSNYGSKPISDTNPRQSLTSNLNVGIRKNGGLLNKLQVGGMVTKTNTSTSDSNKVKNVPVTNYKPTKVTNLLNDSYEMGTQEKLEMGALIADLTGVGLAMTGAGSVAAGVTGVAGTAAQFAADVRRDGLDWGDGLSAVVGLGLDAASAIPGLGIGSKGAKAVKTIKRSAKYLMPALTAIGAGSAAKLLGEIAFTDKKISDLSMDDLRTLTNGIHGVMGGTRIINNRMALKRPTTNSLALAGGKKVDLTPEQTKTLSSLTGEAKVNKAKEFAMDNLDAPVVNLKTVKDGAGAKAQFWKSTDATKNKEIVDISTRKGDFELKDINNYQGEGLKNSYMRWAINKAAIRNPNLNGKSAYVDLPEATRAKQWGWLGDYTRKNTLAGPSNVYGPSSIRGENSMYGQNSMYGEFSTMGPSSILGPSSRIVESKILSSILQSPSRQLGRGAIPLGAATTPTIVSEPSVGVKFNNTKTNKVTPGRKGAATKKQNKANKGKKAGDQLAAFKEGGILFAQRGQTAYRRSIEEVNPQADLQALLNGEIDASGLTAAPFDKSQIPGIMRGVGNVLGWNTPTAEIPSDPANPRKRPTAKTEDGNIWSKLKGLAGQVNTNDVSEFGRALATRAVNQRIDTRVEAPLLAPALEVDVPVQGNLLNRSMGYNRAAELQRTGAIPRTSDSHLNMIQNLAVNGQADAIRGQADAENANALNASKMMNIENIARNNMMRNEVANRNISTLAGAKQAERSAENQKLGMVAQPLLSFWENKNAETLRKNAQAKQIDNQITLSTLSTRLNDIKRPLDKRALEFFNKSMDEKLSAEQRASYSKQYEGIMAQIDEMTGLGKNNALQLMKNVNYAAPTDYYSKFLKPVYAKGGALNKNIKELNKLNKEVYKERLKELKDVSKANEKGNSMTTKEIQKLINKALNFK